MDDWQTFGLIVLEVSSNNRGQITTHEIDAIGEVIQGLKQEAKRHQVAAFESDGRYLSVLR